MRSFEIDQASLAEKRAEAESQAREGLTPALAGRLAAGEELSDVELTALFLASDVSTRELLDLARDRRGEGAPQIETFSPLYITNECDGECAMCGMRRFNASLQRETASPERVREQLEILHRRGIRGVALLTGEYRHGPQRGEMLARTADATRDAIGLGFQHVLINIGALEQEEYDTLLEGLERTSDGRIEPRVTMCTFQEAYDPSSYEKFMGSSPENPRSDYQRRLENFDRAASAGMRFANPGLLLGLNRDLAFELLALLAHVRHLQQRGMTVYISVPRLRKASGAEHRAGVSDDELFRIVSVLSAGRPQARVVISTREAPEVQQRLLPVIGVLTPGSPGVAPYTDEGARFELEASQFEVLDHRPIEAILDDCLAVGATIECYEPPHRPARPSAEAHQTSPIAR